MTADTPDPYTNHDKQRPLSGYEARGPDAAYNTSWHTIRDKIDARLLYLCGTFVILFTTLIIKLLLATVLLPVIPDGNILRSSLPNIPDIDPVDSIGSDINLPQIRRASIVDRNGQILAISLPVSNIYANPMQLIDPQETAKRLSLVIPNLDIKDTSRKLRQLKQFVYIARDVTPAQQMAVNNLGLPGIYFETSERRYYPLGRTASHILGGVDIDGNGIAGIEKYFNEQLNDNKLPIRLSLDIRVQTATREELETAQKTFQAEASAAIVMNVHNGEILAMVSLPDYNANNFRNAPTTALFNHAVTGMYEPGSTFKLQTAAMGLQLGIIHVWDRFSTVPIKIGRFTIRDLKTDRFPPWMSFPQILAFSSNPASARIALTIGAKHQQDWLKTMGFLDRVPIELPESVFPIIPKTNNWGISTVMTIGFGHGIAVSPLAIARGTAVTINGGYLITPTLLAQNSTPFEYTQDQDENEDASFLEQGKREIPRNTPHVISEKNSLLLRKILRLVVTKGIGKRAESPGYFVGGKTGTAEKINPKGGYLKNQNISAFTAVFPMNDPKYVVYAMLDHPRPTAETYGWTTAGWNAAPTVSRIISRIAPILGLYPVTGSTDRIDKTLDIPLQPPIPTGVRALGPGNDPSDRQFKRIPGPK